MERAKSGHEHSTKSTQRFLKRHLGEAGVLLTGAAASFSIANANGFESQLGPIKTETSVSSGDNTLRYGADMIRFDSPYPVGARVEIQSVATSDITDLGELGPYLQDAGAAQQIIANDIARQGGLWALGGAGTAAILMGLCRTDSRRKLIVAGASGSVTLGAGVSSLTNNQDRDWQQISYYGQAVPSIEVSGPTAREAIKFMSKNEAYYSSIDQKVAAALEPIAAEDQERGDKAMLFVTDHHCNMGQYRIIGTIADKLNVDTLLNGGDETMGTPVDPLCFNIRNERLGEITNRINILGNHDNSDTKQLYKSSGDTLLDGQSVTVDGLTIAGFSDPTITPFGGETRLRSNETRPEYLHRIGQAAEQINPDITLVHNPDDAKAVSPYSNLTLSGHLHKANGPIKSPVSSNWQYTGGTSGGHANKHITQFQTLGTDSTVMVIYSNDGQLTGTREIVISPTQNVNIQDYTPFDIDTRPNDQQPAGLVP